MTADAPPWREITTDDFYQGKGPCAIPGTGIVHSSWLRNQQEKSMREPIKPGHKEVPNAGSTKEGGALGNIDELTGHPGKGLGRSLKESENGDPAKGVQPGKPKGGTA